MILKPGTGRSSTSSLPPSPSSPPQQDMTGYLYPLFPIFSALGFVLVLIPLPWHLEAWNSGTCYYMIWTALACFNSFVNSIAWADDALNRAPVWCDICTCYLLRQLEDVCERSTFYNSNKNNPRRVCWHTRCVHVHHAKVTQHFQYSGSSHITGRCTLLFVLRSQGSIVTLSQKRRVILIDSLICVLLPLVVMALGKPR